VGASAARDGSRTGTLENPGNLGTATKQVKKSVLITTNVDSPSSDLGILRIRIKVGTAGIH
jgi:hypothetical protein